jgi:hypothetical protein
MQIRRQGRMAGVGQALLGLCLLTACQTAAMPEAPSRSDLTLELVRARNGEAPKGPAGACWAKDVTPMVIETVTEQAMVSPEKLDDQGHVIKPATFRSETHQQIVQQREEVWFRSPCPQEMTVDFIATLQRALKARGLYLLPLSGAMDAPTRAAVHRFQLDRGLDSPELSLAAARELGIVAANLDRL